MIKKSIKKTILQGMLGQGATNSGYITIAPSCYVGLSTTEITEGDDGVSYTEPSAEAGYKRYLIGDCRASSTFRMTIKADGTAENSDTLYFDEALDDWGTVAYFGLFAGATENNIVAWGKIVNEDGIPTPITVNKGQLPIIRAKQLRLSLLDTDETTGD